MSVHFWCAPAFVCLCVCLCACTLLCMCACVHTCVHGFLYVSVCLIHVPMCFLCLPICVCVCARVHSVCVLVWDVCPCACVCVCASIHMCILLAHGIDEEIGWEGEVNVERYSQSPQGKGFSTSGLELILEVDRFQTKNAMDKFAFCTAHTGCSMNQQLDRNNST